ncbi:MAG: DNA repair protein RecO [Dehalococcoidales bacterium]|nr:DNA repair protein RecO [Dehalococcoidales bacterium]
MPRPRSYQTEAVIIKKTKLGEADRILTLYTPDSGKVQAVAKGVRRPKSKMAGHLELLTHSQVTLARGRNLDIITGSQTIDSFLPLKTDLWLTSYGLYVIELVNQFTADHVEDESLFHLLLETLQSLCQSNNRELLLRYFEIHLLEASGYRPQLQECVACHRALEPITNSFCASIGGTLCPACGMNQPFARPISVNALKVFRFIQGNDFNAVGRLKIDVPLSRELESITRSYLKYLLERDVKSANWLDELKEQMRQADTDKDKVHQPSSS